MYVFVPVNTNTPAPCLTNDTVLPEITPVNMPLPVWLIVSVRPFAKAKLYAPFTLLPLSHTSPVVAFVVARFASNVKAPPDKRTGPAMLRLAPNVRLAVFAACPNVRPDKVDANV